MQEEGTGVRDPRRRIDQRGVARVTQLDRALDRDGGFGTDSIEETHMVPREAVLATAVQTQHAYDTGTADQGNGSHRQQDTELGGIAKVTRLHRWVPIDYHPLCFGHQVQY